ncbi:MAG: universal stress protein [Pseudomonadota bacterium]
MKNIFLLVHDDEGQEARFQAALDLTRAFTGHLTCVDVSMFPMVVGDFYGGGYGEAMLMAEEREREGKNKAKLQGRLAHEDVSWNWIDATGNPADCVLQAANLADLIVLNRKLDAFPYPDMRDIASRILTHARKPVVAVPDSLKRFDTGRALIAWDGKDSAAATMRACVPLLKLASEVRIFMAHAPKSTPDADDAAAYLSRHGIHASVSLRIDDGTGTIDTLIADECADWRPDYVMMGAYSHGRLMEAFGGVTKRMLAHSKLPLVLGH